jgi:hypothetical protein
VDQRTLAEKDLGNGWPVPPCSTRPRRRDLQPAHPGTTVSRVQNIAKVHHGLRARLHGAGRVHAGLRPGRQPDFRRLEDRGEPRAQASVGKWQPRVALALHVFATYKPDAQWAFTAAAPCSRRQYSNMDNSDVNAFAYFGATLLTVTAGAPAAHKRWSGSVGFANANSAKYWHFHPSAEHLHRGTSLRPGAKHLQGQPHEPLQIPTGRFPRSRLRGGVRRRRAWRRRPPVGVTAPGSVPCQARAAPAPS